MTTLLTLSDTTLAARDYGSAGRYLTEALRIANMPSQFSPAEFIEVVNGLAHVSLARFDDAMAEQHFANAIEVAKRWPDAATRLSIVYNNQAEVYRALGRYADAERLYGLALQTERSASPSDTAVLAQILNNLAITYRQMARPEQAAKLLREVLITCEASTSISKEFCANAHMNLANALMNISDPEGLSEALTLLNTAIDELTALFGAESTTRWRLFQSRAAMFANMGNFNSAIADLTVALRLAERAVARDSIEFIGLQSSLGNALRLAGQLDAALPLLKRAYDFAMTRPEAGSRVIAASILRRPSTRRER